MAPRARIPLICVYVLLAACGAISLVTPVSSVANTVIPVLVKCWGVFFLVGGVTSTTAIIYRWARTSALGWWYIEISGLCLLATSSFIYASVLVAITFQQRSLGVAGISCLVLSLAASLVGRAIDAYRIAKLERRILDELHLRDQGV